MTVGEEWRHRSGRDRTGNQLYPLLCHCQLQLDKTLLSHGCFPINDSHLKSWLKTTQIQYQLTIWVCKNAGFVNLKSIQISATNWLYDYAIQYPFQVESKPCNLKCSLFKGPQSDYKFKTIMTLIKSWQLCLDNNQDNNQTVSTKLL